MTVWEWVGLAALMLAGLSAAACAGLVTLCALALVRDARTDRHARPAREDTLARERERERRFQERASVSQTRPYGCGVVVELASRRHQITEGGDESA